MGDLFDQDGTSSRGVRENTPTIDDMRNWFLSNFEDPANSLPYITAEGGYQWIFGGPCNADEELQHHFGGVASEEDIEELVSELEKTCTDWTPIYDHNADYEDYLSVEDLHYSKAEAKLKEHLEDVLQLESVSFTESLSNKYRQMLYANVIGALEAYLCERFMQLVFSHHDSFKKFVSTYPKYKDEKVGLRDIFIKVDNLREEVRKELLDFVWHRLFAVKAMFKDTLDVDFADIDPLREAVAIRNDIVHRNGVNKEGQDVVVRSEALLALIKDVTALVTHLEEQLANKFTPLNPIS
ncbi:HEPN domain-containing protein [Vogesella mureinivorans]|uniref:HEPN domain-containing protein n=1 Tax=Vogesella mureinivorans TaxID=657276 RepID=UPI0011CB1386|nr:HEPN domain-containing protein [Vogesella mureinivorans]